MRPRSIAALCVLVAIGFAVRSLGLREVFGDDGRIYLALHDASLHARRSLYSFVNFPSVLFFDSYLNFPDGAPVPLAPLYDWLLAAVARGFGSSISTFERAAAWISPVLGALTVLPVYAMGRLLGGRGVALGAAAIFALLPMATVFSGVGNCDHHAAVALLSATFLALLLDAVGPETKDAPAVARAAVLALVRTALILTWSGSLLYLALGDGLLLLAALLAGRHRLMIRQAGSALGTALLVAPWVAAAGTPIGGSLSSINLSWLHVLVLVGLSAFSGGLAALERAHPSPDVARRALRAFGLGAALLAFALSFSTLRDALAPGAGFVSKLDSWAAANPEQRPLFGIRLAWRSPVQLYGLFAYLIPLAVLIPLLRAREARLRGPALCFAGWSAVLGGLALAQVRFGNDFAPAAAVGFALLFAEFPRRLAARAGVTHRAACVAAVSLGFGCLWPGVRDVHVPKLSAALDFLRGSASGRLTARQSLERFAETVRKVTPETSGFLDSSETPEYSILCPPTLGYSLMYEAHRPTPANNMGPYMDAERFRATNAFFAAHSEARGLALAESLGSRYVLTVSREQNRSAQLDFRLHRGDGSADGQVAHLGHFRLIAEGPEGGRPLRLMYPRHLPARLVPYKLFEIVEGAVLEVRADAGSEISAELRLRTPIGRRFRFRARARADDDGIARVRVPYATGSNGQIEAEGVYAIRVGDTEYRASVAEVDVSRGRTVRVRGAPAQDLAIPNRSALRPRPS